MTTSMTRRQFLARALGTLAITSSCTALAVRPKATPDVYWSPTFSITVSDRDVLLARNAAGVDAWWYAFERNLAEVEPDLFGAHYRIHEIARLSRDHVWQVSVSMLRFV